MLCLGLCSLLIAGCTFKGGNEILAKKTQEDFKKELIKGKTTKFICGLLYKDIVGLRPCKQILTCVAIHIPNRF